MKTNFSTSSDFFASVSGDHNPLHVDNEYAKRTPYGRRVVHGVELVFHVLDFIASQKQEKFLVGAVGVSFFKPAFCGEELKLTIDEVRPNVFRGDIWTANGTTCLADISVKIDEYQKHQNVPYVDFDEKDVRDIPISQAGAINGFLELGIGAYHLDDVFPSLHKCVSELQIAELLALTRAVGMRCPGRRAVFNSFSISKAKHTTSSHMNYRVSKVKKPIGMLELGFSGPTLQGIGKASYLPEPQEFETDFSSLPETKQKALVVGGTGGLGAQVVKALTSSGSEVVFTHRGESCERASAVVAETGATAQICEGSSERIKQIMDAYEPTHIYFMVSPRIFDRASDSFDTKKLTRLSNVYISLLEKYLEHSKGCKVFIPSTEALNTCPEGMAEYIAAKAATEAWCKTFELHNKQFKFIVHRMPRMATEQTASNFVKSASPEKPIIDAILDMEK